MDPSIKAATPDMMRERGALAFDQGRGIDDHHMNPSAPAVTDWRLGWMERRAERRAEHAHSCVDQLLILAMGMTS